jgi:hypothetical protein
MPRTSTVHAATVIAIDMGKNTVASKNSIRRGIGATRQNRSMMEVDDCHHARTLDVHCRLIQAALAASGREPVSSPQTRHRN